MTAINGMYAEGEIRPAYMQRYSRLAELILLLVLVAMVLEGIFHRYVESLVSTRSVIYSAVVPWNAYPSELLFYGPILLMGIAWTLAGPRSVRSARGVLFLALYLGIGAVQAFHGWHAGSHTNLWLAFFRQVFLGSVFVPIFAVIGSNIRLSVVMQRFVTLAIPLAVLNAIMGAMVLAGILERFGTFEPYWSGDMLLLLAYLFSFAKGIYVGPLKPLQLTILAVGVLMPLNKPTIAVFVVAQVLLLIALNRFRRPGQGSLLPPIKAMAVICFALPIFMVLTQLIGGDTAQTFLSQRFFKTGLRDTDISSGRFEMWAWAWEQFKENWVIGTGLGIEPLTRTAEGRAKYLDIHNLTLGLLYQTGLFCFMMIVGILVLWCRRVFRYLSAAPDVTELWPGVALFVWVLCILAISQTQGTLAVFNLGSVFWVCIGLLNQREVEFQALGGNVARY